MAAPSSPKLEGGKIDASKENFPCKMYSMVSFCSENAPHVMAWMPEGDSFVIKDIPALEQEFLAQYFKHNKFQSLVRQLNKYGFRKFEPVQEGGGVVVRRQHGDVYKQQDGNFHRDRKDLLIHVRPQGQGKPQHRPKRSVDESADEENGIFAMEARISRVEAAVVRVEDKVDRLLSLFEMLADQLPDKSFDPASRNTGLHQFSNSMEPAEITFSGASNGGSANIDIQPIPTEIAPPALRRDYVSEPPPGGYPRGSSHDIQFVPHVGMEQSEAGARFIPIGGTAGTTDHLGSSRGQETSRGTVMSGISGSGESFSWRSNELMAVLGSERSATMPDRVESDSGRSFRMADSKRSMTSEFSAISETIGELGIVKGEED